jgi:hypothetical protein
LLFQKIERAATVIPPDESKCKTKRMSSYCFILRFGEIRREEK